MGTLKAIMTGCFFLFFVFVVSEGKAEETKSLDLAVALVEIDGTASGFDGIAYSLVQQQSKIVLSDRPNLDPKKLEKFKTLLLEGLTKQRTDFLRRMAELYATHFTRNDLQGLVAFYQTDLGKKAMWTGLRCKMISFG